MADHRDDDSGDGPTPPFGHRADPRHAPPTLALISRRAGDTLDRVEGVRIEVRAHLERQDGVLEGMQRNVALMLRLMGVDQRERSEIRISAEQAKIEVKKTGELAIIDEQKAIRAHQRERTLKILAIIGPIITAALTAWLFGGCL